MCEHAPLQRRAAAAKAQAAHPPGRTAASAPSPALSFRSLARAAALGHKFEATAPRKSPRPRSAKGLPERLRAGVEELSALHRSNVVQRAQHRAQAKALVSGRVVQRQPVIQCMDPEEKALLNEQSAPASSSPGSSAANFAAESLGTASSSSSSSPSLSNSPVRPSSGGANLLNPEISKKIGSFLGLSHLANLAGVSKSLHDQLVNQTVGHAPSPNGTRENITLKDVSNDLRGFNFRGLHGASVRDAVSLHEKVTVPETRNFGGRGQLGEGFYATLGAGEHERERANEFAEERVKKMRSSSSASSSSASSSSASSSSASSSSASSSSASTSSAAQIFRVFDKRITDAEADEGKQEKFRVVESTGDKKGDKWWPVDGEKPDYCKPPRTRKNRLTNEDVTNGADAVTAGFGGRGVYGNGYVEKPGRQIKYNPHAIDAGRVELRVLPDDYVTPAYAAALLARKTAERAQGSGASSNPSAP